MGVLVAQFGTDVAIRRCTTLWALAQPELFCLVWHHPGFRLSFYASERVLQGQGINCMLIFPRCVIG
jgi:hypothetical protein